MNYRPLFLITGAVLSKIAFFMLFPLALAYYTKTLGTLEFALAMALTFAASGFLVYFGKEKEKSRLGIREMFKQDGLL